MMNVDSGDEREDFTGTNAERFAAGSGRDANDEKDPNLLYGPEQAQWVLAVLDEMITKLNVCSYLTPNILKDKMIDAMDHELVTALRAHFQIEKEYIEKTKILEAAERKEIEAGIINQRTDHNRALMEEMDICVADSTRNVCRLLTGYQHNLIVVRHLRELCTKRSPSVLEYLTTFSRLRKLVHAKLKMTAEEERAIHDQLSELERKQKDDDDKHKELLEKLQKEHNEHRDSMRLKDQKITRLEKQIEELKAETTQRREDFEESMQRQENEQKQAFDSSKQKLSSDLKELGAQLAKQAETNVDSEKGLHGKVKNKGEQLQGTILNYDAQMRSKHDELNALEATFNKESRELVSLDLHFKDFDDENERVRREMQEIREKRDMLLLAERKRNHAALQVRQLFDFFLEADVKARRKAAKAAKGDKKDKKK